MVESQPVAKQALKKLEDQLTCAICLGAFKDPKLLQCFHVYCKDCLQQHAIGTQEQLSLHCPTCQQSTILPPATCVSDLQPAFHINHLLQITKVSAKIKESKMVMCEKCNKENHLATGYCINCEKLICAKCKTTHSEWNELSIHEIITLEQLESKIKRLISLKKVILYCSLHKHKELELYCETCEELICHNCTVKKHKNHQYDLVDDTFEKHKAEMVASLEPVENQLGIVNKALKQIEQRSGDVNEQRVATKTEIQKVVQQLHEMLEARKTELMGKVDEYADQKVKNLATQKDEVETVETQLASCLSFMRESLRTGSQGEVMKMKKTVMKQIKEMTGNFKPDQLAPCEIANLKFVCSPKLVQTCQHLGEVYMHARKVAPEKCCATGEGLVSARVGERATATVHIVDNNEKACVAPIETKCELVLARTGTKTKCLVKNLEASVYEISFEATSRGRHQLHIKVEGEHIKESPFSVNVVMPVQMLGIPIGIIPGINGPWGVAVNQSSEIVVAEYKGQRVSIFNRKGEKLRSFGSQGSGHGQFSNPEGVAVDDDGNILVADYGNNRLQKFTPLGKFVTEVSINYTAGISFHSDSKKIAVANCNEKRIHILNPDLTFHNNFGEHNRSGAGLWGCPFDVAYDRHGNIYVGDSTCTNGIQVFTAEGQYLRKIGSQGSGQGELNYPSGIAINDDLVYVSEHSNNRISIFKTDGTFLTSFGTKGNEPGQFNNPCGIAVDKDGYIYASDQNNRRIQIF